MVSNPSRIFECLVLRAHVRSTDEDRPRIWIAARTGGSEQRNWEPGVAADVVVDAVGGADDVAVGGGGSAVRGIVGRVLRVDVMHPDKSMTPNQAEAESRAL